MTIEIITAWYNEEFLAPFFLKHYDFADRITVLLDSATNDRTEYYLLKNWSVEITTVDYKGKMSERIKRDCINKAYRNSTADYVVIVDADEFVFFDNLDFGFDLSRVRLFNVYRHVEDSNLDSGKLIREQRRHGVHIWPYLKPIVAKTGLDLKWGIGNHLVKYKGEKELYKDDRESGLKYGPELKGAHWIFADQCFCVNRRLDRSRRFGSTHGLISREDIEREIESHRYDPMVL